MAARTWFTPKVCEGLTHDDCRVLNTAARHAFPPHTKPSHLELVVLRTAYRPGMSARDLLAATGHEE